MVYFVPNCQIARLELILQWKDGNNTRYIDNMTTEEISSKQIDLKFYFVVKDGIEDIENVASDLSSAFACISEYVEEEMVIWITEEDLMKTAPKTELTKKDIFVLESFEGRAFECLRKTKSLVIGPRCMLSCLMDNTSIPLGASPIFTTAMQSLIICPSGLARLEKGKLKDLVLWMGGHYTDDLTGNCTHLVSNTVKSNKYEKAALNNIAIMHPDWVHDVWARSKKENILATSKEFQKYKLPIFYGLHITTSHLSGPVKANVMKLVNENGGHYTSGFGSKTTDVVITEKDKTDTPKFQAAARFKKLCLVPQWITDSVNKGYALPTEQYKIVALETSTQMEIGKSVCATDFNPDCAQLSEIPRMASLRPNADVNVSATPNVKTTPLKSARPSYKDVLTEISTQQAKKAGSFLDGCCVYLAGFTAVEKEKLHKILSVGGAIRYDEMNEKITHCVVGKPTQNELNKIDDHGVVMLSLEWLVESIKQENPVNEENFIYRAQAVKVRAAEPPSPSSKKTIESMNHSFKKPAVPKSLFGSLPMRKYPDMDCFEKEQNEFLSQYTPENVTPLPPKRVLDAQPAPKALASASFENADSEMCTEDYENLNFLIGLTVHVHDHDEEIYQQLVYDCENAGATVVDKGFEGIVDYVIVPCEEATDLKEVKVKAKHIVNNLWIEDSMKENKTVDIKYYHEPIPISVHSQPLTGMEIVISVYSHNERVYIDALASLLGAKKNDSYAKKNKPLLICPTADGAKYNAAIKWNYPVVKSDWLVECANTGQKESLEPYLVGDSTLTQCGSWNALSDVSVQVEGQALPSSSAASRASSDRGNDFVQKVFQPQRRSPRKSNTQFGSIEKPASIANTPGDIVDAERDTRHKVGKQVVEDNRNAYSTSLHDQTMLQHRRLSELSEPGRRISERSHLATTTTPSSQNDCNIGDILKEISSPNHDVSYKRHKEMRNKEKPESQRIQKSVALSGAESVTPTPKNPDFVATADVRKRRLDLLDSYYLPPAKAHKPQISSREVQRRIWTEAFGEQFLEKACYSSSSQLTQDISGTFAAAGRDTQSGSDANIHVQRLSDFINNREREKRNRNGSPVLPEFDIESAPRNVDSEMGGTEQMIVWRDPSEFTQDNRMKHVGTPRFSVSCTNEALRQKILNQIAELKGEVFESETKFSKACTHILCERPNRGERILCGIAAGKWILALSYVEDSTAAGHFLDEELYEWGNPSAIKLPELAPNEQPLAAAAFRWRKKAFSCQDKSQSGAFWGFRVILHVTKMEQFQNFIVAGGGVVIAAKEPYADCEEALSATHCFVEAKRKLLVKDHKKLALVGVLVLSITYLNAYLISDAQVDYKKYLL